MVWRTVVVVVLFVVVADGCRKQAPSKQSVAEECRMLVDQLGSDDATVVEAACKRLFEHGAAAVPVLLERATDDEVVSWTPPVFSYTSRYPVEPGWTRGNSALYLVESIRVGRLDHSSLAMFCAREVLDDTEAALGEYREWWQSIQSDSGAPIHEPRVTWALVPDEVRAKYAAVDWCKPTCIGVPVYASMNVGEVARLVGPGTAKAEVRRRVARYEDASHELTVTPSQFLPGGWAWLRGGIKVFVVFDREEHQVKEVHIEDQTVHVDHGIGAGSTFEAVRAAYPEAEVRTLAGYGTEVEVAPGVVLLFGEHWEGEVPEHATVSAIVLRAGAGDDGSLRAPSGRKEEERRV